MKNLQLDNLEDNNKLYYESTTRTLRTHRKSKAVQIKSLMSTQSLSKIECLDDQVLGSFRQIRTKKSFEKADFEMIGKYSRDNQLASAAAGTGRKSVKFLHEALDCKNPKYLDFAAIQKTRDTGDSRITELTPLMIACIMGNL